MSLDSDFRIKTGFFGHYKRKKLQRASGADGIVALFELWAWSTNHRPTGDLSGMSNADIADVTSWPDKPDKLIEGLIFAEFLDGDAGAYQLHDFEEEQSWVQERVRRQERGRKGAIKTNAKLSPEQRSANAKKAAAARHRKSENTENTDQDTCAANRAECDESAQLSAQVSALKNVKNDTFDNDSGRLSHFTPCAAPVPVPVPTQNSNTAPARPDGRRRSRNKSDFTLRGSNTAARTEPVTEAPCPTTTSTRWPSVQAILQARIAPDMFAKWIAPIEAFASEGTTDLTLCFEDTYTAKYVQDNFSEQLKDAWWDVAGGPIRINFRVISRQQGA